MVLCWLCSGLVVGRSCAGVYAIYLFYLFILWLICSTELYRAIGYDFIFIYWLCVCWCFVCVPVFLFLWSYGYMVLILFYVFHLWRCGVLYCLLWLYMFILFLCSASGRLSLGYNVYMVLCAFSLWKCCKCSISATGLYLYTLRLGFGSALVYSFLLFFDSVF